MRRWVLLSMLAGGCGGPTAQVDEMHMAIDGASGLSSSQVGSVAVLVLGGDDCSRALKPHSPLDDPSLPVFAHALFTVDGTAKRLSGVPAGQSLLFYVDAFDSPDGSRPRVGRGCAQTSLSPGASAGVSITLTAAPDD